MPISGIGTVIKFLFSRWGIIVCLSIAVGFLGWSNERKSSEIVKLEERLDDTKDKLKTAEANLERKKQEFEIITQYKEDLEDSYRDLRNQHKGLEDKFNMTRGNGSKRDIGALALVKPGLVEKAVNGGTSDAMRCAEIASGSPLTEEEKAATKKSQINTSCPGIANPNYMEKPE